jgi:O-antigen/teichoic acid export membrane protein
MTGVPGGPPQSRMLERSWQRIRSATRLDPDRARSRSQRIAISSAASVFARLASVGISFLSVPIALGYLGIERYGVWATLTAAASVLVFADLGLGNALINDASRSLALDERPMTRKAFSTSVLMLSAIGVVLALACLPMLLLVDWHDVLRLGSDISHGEARAAVAATALAFVVTVPLSVTERMRLALQEGYANSAWTLLGLVGSLVALVLLVEIRAPLPVIILGSAAGPILALAANGLALLRSHPWLRPRFALSDRETASRLARLGWLFFVLQLAMGVAYQSDIVVAGSVLGPGAAATYAVTLRLFTLAPKLVELLLLQIWPAYTDALARGDPDWVRSTLRKSVVIAFGTSTAWATGLVILAGPILDIWTGGTIHADAPLLIGLAVWTVLQSTFNAITILMNAAAVVRFQVIVAVVMATASILASVVLANAVGIAGVIWGTVGAYVVFAGIPTLLYLPRLLRRIAPEQLPHPVVSS